MDAVKLLLKEDIVPEGADKPLHTIAPILFFAVSLLAWVVVPWDDQVVIGRLLDQNIGVLFLMGVGGITVVNVVQLVRGLKSRRRR